MQLQELKANEEKQDVKLVANKNAPKQAKNKEKGTNSISITLILAKDLGC